MSLTHVTRLLATGAVATALATGGLSLTPQAAHAAQAATTYSCNFGSNGTYNIPVSFALPNLPTAALAGVPIPQQPIVATMSLPAGLAAKLVGNGGTLKAAIENLLVTVGLGQLPVSLAGPSATASSGSAATLVAGGFLGSTTPGAPGTLGFAFPSAFDLGVQKGNGAKVGTYSCSQAAPTNAGSVQVSRQTSKMSGKVVDKRVTRSENAQVQVTVRRQVGDPDGKVIATSKGQVLGKRKLRNGTALLKLDTLSPGVWKVRLHYNGDTATTGSTKTVTVHVTR